MTEADHAREIAERIARRVANTPPASRPVPPKAEVTSELAAVRAGLSELQRKISQLEAKISSASVDSTADFSRSNSAPAMSYSERSAPLTHSPWLAGVNASVFHASQEKFGVEEAVVSELVDYFEKEKTCSVEPGGKPCDHCAMCNTRGF